MEAEITDYALVKQCIAGDHDAFAELVTRYKKLVYSVVYNMINDKQEVNDVAQEVFLRIYKSLDRYNPEYKFSTWTVKIATNLCLDMLRRKRAEQIPIEEIENHTSEAGTPEEKYIEEERSRMLKEAVKQLPEKYRVPIILFHQNGLSYDEITKVLGEPMTIVKNRIYRARLMLKEKLLSAKREEIL